MRKIIKNDKSKCNVIIVDDEIGIINSLKVVLKRQNYTVTAFLDPEQAVEAMKNEKFDLLILDFIMDKMNGEKVVQKVREFDTDLHIILLTGHRDTVPPLSSMRNLDIQAYCEKSENFDQLVVMAEAAVKCIDQINIIKKFQDGLSKILESMPKIYQIKSVDSILSEILNQLVYFAKSNNAFILIDSINNSTNANKSSVYKGMGRFNIAVEEFASKMDYETLELIGDVRTSGKVTKDKNMVAFPIKYEDENVFGVMYIEISEIGQEEMGLLEIYSIQVAAAINNAFLHSLINVKNKELNRTYSELEIRYMDTIEALRMTVDAKDYYTRGHSDRVACYAVQIGIRFGLPKNELTRLKLSGVFHDIGKIGTADDILLKTSKLSNEEFEEIKKHPLKGANILSAVSMFKDIIQIVLSHHERVDGKGYPRGLKGEQIPFLARIVSVADAYDAMMSDRQYRSKLSVEETREQLIRGKGTQFDNDVVNKFLEIVEHLECDKFDNGCLNECLNNEELETRKEKVLVHDF